MIQPVAPDLAHTSETIARLQSDYEDTRRMFQEVGDKLHAVCEALGMESLLDGNAVAIARGLRQRAEKAETQLQSIVKEILYARSWSSDTIAEGVKQVFDEMDGLIEREQDRAEKAEAEAAALRGALSEWKQLVDTVLLYHLEHDKEALERGNAIRERMEQALTSTDAGAKML